MPRSSHTMQWHAIRHFEYGINGIILMGDSFFVYARVDTFVGFRVEYFYVM